MYSREQIFVDGEWREASSRETIDVINPHTERPIGRIVQADATDVDRAVRSAERALSGPWARCSLDERCDIVKRLADLLESRRDELAQLQTESMGAPRSMSAHLGGAVSLAEAYIDAVREVDFSYVRSDRYGTCYITRRPVGVVGAIVPWNAPIRTEVKKTVPALLAGCTVVLKPAPETPFGAAVFAELCSEAGLPPGVVNLVPGGASTGESLVSHPAVRKIAFTGSSATGARIAALAGPSFKRLQLELGGKSAAILLDDVRLADAMPMLVTGNWGNSGQICTAISRVLVPRSRYREVIDAFAAAAAAQVVGDPSDSATTLGPLVAERQRTRVLGYIDAGRRQGARLVAGGGRPAHLTRGWYVEPTVFSDVSNDMTIARDEIFGPVTCLMPYDSEDEAIAIANDTPYGLHGAVFGADEARALEVAQKVDAGGVGINSFAHPNSAPFGGVKASGTGREHGPEGFDSYLEYVTYLVSPALANVLLEASPPA